MRMCARPRDFGGEFVARLRASADLQPAEDRVKLRRVADEAELAASLLRAPKTSEEKKQVPRTYRLICEMALRGSGLAEDWTPARGARERIAAQVGIEMRASAVCDSATGQVFDDLRDARAVERDLFVGGRRSRIGNRERA